MLLTFHTKGQTLVPTFESVNEITNENYGAVLLCATVCFPLLTLSVPLMYIDVMNCMTEQPMTYTYVMKVYSSC